MPDDQFLNDLAEGDRFVGFVALRRMETRQRRDGTFFLDLDFSDRSGRLGGKLWDHVEEFRKTLKVGGIVKLQGAVILYQGQKEIQIERLRTLRSEETVDKSRLIACSERPIDEMHRHLRRLIELVEQADLRAFLRRFFDDPAISQPYFEAPAGKQWHGAYLGGLAEHSLNIAELLLKSAELYPNTNKDLLIAGALLHDVGKIKEFCWDVSIDYTDQGRLIGHIVIGQDLLNAHRGSEASIPQELWDQLIHLVLSHQGTHEQGAVTLPMTLEAILLWAADEMESKANAFNRIIARSRERGDRWTEWVNLMGRYLYVGGEEKLAKSD
jgi:3'-5' exoribonuclease